MPQPTDKDVRHVHYVIVVHGIGEQRPNETVLSVINRFAEARQMDYKDLPNESTKFPEMGGFVTMGKVAAQMGTEPKDDGRFLFAGKAPWAQFEGIPSERGGKAETFNAIQSTGEDTIRFVDIYWSDILNDYFGASGQDVKTWTDSVISRMQNIDEYKKEMAAKGEEDEKHANLDTNWVLKVLQQVQEAALFCQKVASLPGIKKTEELDAILDAYVGDIQIYGENRSVRGRAVRRFHDLMEDIHKNHCETYGLKQHTSKDEITSMLGVAAGAGTSKRMEQKMRYMSQEEKISYIPKYSIIAHSLGTVMAMDSLMYAHVRSSAAYPEGMKTKDTHQRNLPFEQYCELVERDHEHDRDMDYDHEDMERRLGNEFIGSNWIHDVEAFVTLGSPIDKYLTLWPENYDYLDGLTEQGTSETGQIFSSREGYPKIRHYNYSDEQDPVGHHLDLFSETEAYSVVFDNIPDRDVTYNSYKVPGVAHVKYWEDQGLFRRILHQTVDGEEEGSGAAFSQKRSTISNFWMVMIYTYYAPALFAGFVMAGLFYWGWQAMKRDLNWEIGALAAIGFGLMGYLFRKIISLCVYWRQILRMKSKHQLAIEKDKPKQRQYLRWGAGAIFKTSLFAGVGVLILLSLIAVSTTIANSPLQGEKWHFVIYYFILLILAGLAIYLLGKTSWMRNWVMDSKNDKYAEWLTIAAAGLIGVGVYFIFDSSLTDDAIKSWNCGIPQKFLVPLTMFICGLTIAWTFMTFTFVKVKRELGEW